MNQFVSRAFVVATLGAVMTGGCASKPADILMGPYVSHVSQTEARVLWVTQPDRTDGSLLLTGAPPSAQMGLSTRLIGEEDEGQGRLHVAQIEGLLSDRVTVKPDQFTLRTGFWFAPTVHEVRFGDLQRIELLRIVGRIGV